MDITVHLNPPTLLHWASSPKTQIYLAFHRIEFTDFTTAELYLLSVALVRFLKKGRVLPAILLYGVRTFLSPH